jgi:hypothetical protein
MEAEVEEAEVVQVLLALLLAQVLQLPPLMLAHYPGHRVKLACLLKALDWRLEGVWMTSCLRQDEQIQPASHITHKRLQRKHLGIPLGA